MLLPRFTENLALVALLLTVLRAARDQVPRRDVATEDAEQSRGKAGPTHSARGSDVVRAGDGGHGGRRSADAELRFKEFLLVYPEYPGAYVNLAIIHIRNENEDEARKSWTRRWRWTPITRPL